MATQKQLALNEPLDTSCARGYAARGAQGGRTQRDRCGCPVHAKRRIPKCDISAANASGYGIRACIYRLDLANHDKHGQHASIPPLALRKQAHGKAPVRWAGGFKRQFTTVGRDEWDNLGCEMQQRAGGVGDVHLYLVPARTYSLDGLAEVVPPPQGSAL